MQKLDSGSDDWLAECEVSITPLSDLLVIAKNDRLVVLRGE